MERWDQMTYFLLSKVGLVVELVANYTDALKDLLYVVNLPGHWDDESGHGFFFIHVHPIFKFWR